MGHRVFIRHTYIYKCSDKTCGGEWKINEAADIEKVVVEPTSHQVTLAFQGDVDFEARRRELAQKVEVGTHY